MIRNRTLRTLLVAATACSAIACTKGGGGGIGGGGGTLSGAAASAFDVLPKETSLIFGFSVKAFRDTNFYKMLTDNIPPEGQAQIKTIKDTCGIDVMTDIESLTVGGGANLDKSRVLVLVKGNFNEDKVTKCATAMGTKMNKKVTVTKDGNLDAITVEGESKTVYVGWAGDVAVFSPGAMDGDKTYLSDVLKAKGGVKDNKALMDLVGKCDTGALVWGASTADAGEVGSMMQKLSGGPEKPTGAWLSAKLTKTLDLAAGLRMANDADAKTVADRGTKELVEAQKDPQAGPYLKNASFSQSGSDVNVKLALDEAQVNQLTEMAKQMAPMLKMMMGGGGQ